MEETDERDRPRNPKQISNMKYNERKQDPKLASSGNLGDQGNINK